MARKVALRSTCLQLAMLKFQNLVRKMMRNSTAPLAKTSCWECGNFAKKIATEWSFPSKWGFQFFLYRFWSYAGHLIKCSVVALSGQSSPLQSCLNTLLVCSCMQLLAICLSSIYANVSYLTISCCIMSEGATFNRGFNRALGSLLAGVLAISIAELALKSGRDAEPIIIGFSIFIVGKKSKILKVQNLNHQPLMTD